MEVRATASAITSDDCSLVTLKSGTSTENACVKLRHSGQSGKEITVDFGTHSSENIAVNTVLNKLDLTLYIQTFLFSYDCDNFLRIYSRGERYSNALCGRCSL